MSIEKSTTASFELPARMVGNIVIEFQTDRDVERRIMFCPSDRDVIKYEQNRADSSRSWTTFGRCEVSDVSVSESARGTIVVRFTNSEGTDRRIVLSPNEDGSATKIEKKHDGNQWHRISASDVSNARIERRGFGG